MTGRPMDATSEHLLIDAYEYERDREPLPDEIDDGPWDLGGMQ